MYLPSISHTAAIESTSSGAGTDTNTVARLRQLDQERDQLAQQTKDDLRRRLSMRARERASRAGLS
jgi:hypothetical protein